MTQEMRGWLFPGDLDIPEEPWFRIPFGDSEVRDMTWHGHIELAHQAGLNQLQTEVVDSGVDDDGLRYAVVKTSVVVDGVRYESLSGADTASNQVRDPEHVWSVAESRAIKRAVKKALNIRPADESTAQADEDQHGVQDSGGSVGVGEDGDVEINPPPEYDGDGDGDDAGEDDW